MKPLFSYHGSFTVFDRINGFARLKEDDKAMLIEKLGKGTGGAKKRKGEEGKGSGGKKKKVEETAEEKALRVIFIEPFSKRSRFLMNVKVKAFENKVGIGEHFW